MSERYTSTRARLGHLAREAVLSSIAVLVVLALLESLTRVAYLVRSSAVDFVAMPYVVGGDYGPVPPWREDDGMRVSDDELYWRGNPGFTQRYLNIFGPVQSDADRRAVLYSFWPSIPQSLRESPFWHVRLNSEGFRTEEFTSKPRSVFRVVCLGDSWTFGASVDQALTYPAQLQRLLLEEFPNSEFQVLNLGIIGHSSFQGRRLMRRALQLRPDVVVIGYAMNEDDWAGYEDQSDSSVTQEDARSLIGWMADVFEDTGDYLSENIELYRLLKYWALRLRWHPDPLDAEVRDFVEEVMSLEAAAVGETPEPWLEASLRDYQANLLWMIDDARAVGTDVVLLFPEFWQKSPYLKVLQSVATERRVPIVDAATLIAAAETRFQQDLETGLGLSVDAEPGLGAVPDASASGTVEVVFRVRMGKYPVAGAVSISGTDRELGDLMPNAIKMYDDGTHGDQQAADGVWSLAARLRPGSSIFYVYTNSGRRGEWEGLDLPGIRRVDVPQNVTKAAIYLPIDVFGHMAFRGDPWHTDAEGNGLIAAAVLDRLRIDERFRSHTRTEGRR